MMLAEALHASSRIRGWLTDGEQSLLYRLAQDVPGGGTIVELGSWMGRSTIMLAAGSQSGAGATVYAVDLFAADVGETKDEYSAHLVGEGPDYFPAFERNIRDAGFETAVVPMRGLTGEVGRRWSGGPIDLLFIDADHSYKGVREDFLAWSPHCVPGTHCVFHDYLNPGTRGVFLLVNQLIAAGILDDVEIVDSIAHGTIRASDRGRVERCLRPRPLTSLTFGLNSPPWHRYALMRGWELFHRRKRLEALYYAAHSVTSAPWRRGGWRLLGYAAFRPLPKWG
jgi:MMP 1-O-methyltransferase